MNQKPDWREMAPGPALDRFIAERVGLKVLDGLALTRNGQYIKQWIETENGPKPVPEFSTNPSESVMLFQTELGLEWTIFADTQDDVTCELGHFATEAGQSDQVEYAGWKSKSLPEMIAMAICRAWLKWQERQDHPAPELPPGLKG